MDGGEVVRTTLGVNEGYLVSKIFTSVSQSRMVTVRYSMNSYVRTMSNDPIGLLAHRPPFRFVDVVDELIPGQLCVARWQITGDEAWLAGHFPENPIVPGVLQLEALAQVGAIALLSDERYAGKLPLFGGVDAVRWKRIVRPGDELLLRVEVEQLSARGGWATAVASVSGDTSVRARLLFAIA